MLLNFFSRLSLPAPETLSALFPRQAQLADIQAELLAVRGQREDILVAAIKHLRRRVLVLATI